MQETKKKRIVIASILKPVNDTRMYEKLGMSLAKELSYEVHLIGFQAKPENSEVIFHSLPYFTRISLKRLFAGLHVLQLIKRLKPSLLIITTHELLLEALLCKLMFGTKLVYDVQENYFRNILHTDAFPKMIRPFVASYVRIKETLTAPFINHFLLAEKMYKDEMSFFGKRFTVIENKSRKPLLPVKRSGDFYNLLFSGTLAETTGVFIAIELTVALHTQDNRFTLTIIGSTQQESVLEKLNEVQKRYSFIKLIGGRDLVPHQRIIEKIRECDAGIISYPFNPSTVNSIPTKLYEYLSYKLPIILIHHPVWEDLCAKYDAAVIFDAKILDASKILNALKIKHFYTNEPRDVYWEDEEKRLKNLIYNLL